MGRFVAFAEGREAFWTARGFPGLKIFFSFREESPSILRHYHSLQLSSGCDGYFPLKLHWKTGILPLLKKYIYVSMPCNGLLATSSFFSECVTVKLEFLTGQSEREVLCLQGGVGERVSFGTFERSRF